jgi:hypothetical protein
MQRLQTRAVSSSDTDTIKTIGILHFTTGVHDHIADAKFIQKCSAVGTWARTSAIPSCNVAAATSHSSSSSSMKTLKHLIQ